MPLGVPDCLSRVSLGLAASGVVVESEALGGFRPRGGLPDAVAVFVTLPWSRSAWVIV